MGTGSSSSFASKGIFSSSVAFELFEVEQRPLDGVGNAISLTIGFGIIFLILFEVFMEPICWLFGATKGHLQQGK